MSVKNTPEEKQLRRLRRALKKGRLPAYLDLIQWAKDHGHATTTNSAKKLIFERRIVSDSHPLGFFVVTDDEGNKHEAFSRYVPASLRSTIKVLAE